MTNDTLNGSAGGPKAPAGTSVDALNAPAADGQLVKKKKRSEMGEEERRIARKATGEWSAKLGADINKLWMSRKKSLLSTQNSTMSP